MTAPTPDAAFEQAKTFFLRGLQALQDGRPDAAIPQFEASLSMVPARPSTLTNLGVALLRSGRHAEAAERLQEAATLEPSNADAWGHLAVAQLELGRNGPALDAVGRALALQPAFGMGWTLQGDLLRELGRRDEAIASYERALALGYQPELQRYYLAGLRGDAPPPAPPADYVRVLFDGYAAGFDRHLVQVLHYQAPQVLVQGLEGRRFERVLDLGCGTGLCAAPLRPLARRLEGVDLSPTMVAHARARGDYDAVHEGDLAQFLATTAQRFDLLVAADVFIYVGDLAPVFAGAARVLEPGAAFCFSVEAADEAHPLQLRPTLRYAHSEGYIRSLADQHGFDLLATARHPLRIDQGQPLPGLYAWLARRGPAH